MAQQIAMEMNEDLQLHELDRQDFPGVYDLIERSFPKDEYRPYEESRALLAHPAYHISVFYRRDSVATLDSDAVFVPYTEAGKLPVPDRKGTFRPVDGPAGDRSDIAAFIASWSFPEFHYIEHFAVDPTARNNGLGSRLLNSWSKLHTRGICLEVEPPETEAARRRIHFYERNGFFLNHYPYEQPPIAAGRKAIPLLLMTRGKELSVGEFSEVRDTLYREVYKV